jgi:hypothetical protein
VKVSKPVWIALIVGILLAGYIHFFTGKKKAPVPPAKVVSAVTPAPATAGAPPGVPTVVEQVTTGVKEAFRPQSGSLDVAWTKDPFFLPQVKKEKESTHKTSLKLVAIMEGEKERIAIIDSDVVKKGDIIGGERVQEIEKDKVILVRGGVKRILRLVNIEDMVEEEEIKTKSTERGK